MMIGGRFLYCCCCCCFLCNNGASRVYFLLSVGSVMSIELNRNMIPGNQLPVPKKKNRSSGCYPFRCEAFSSSSFFSLFFGIFFIFFPFYEIHQDSIVCTTFP